MEGTGLNDGEGVERLWSYLRKFSSITKEMTVANRHDLLVGALEHYSNRIMERLGIFIYPNACFKIQDTLTHISCHTHVVLITLNVSIFSFIHLMETYNLCMCFKLNVGERLKAMLEKARKIQEDTRKVYTSIELKHNGM